MIVDAHSHPYDPIAFEARISPPSYSVAAKVMDGRQEADYWGGGLTVDRTIAEMDAAGIDLTLILITERQRTQGGGSVTAQHIRELYLQPHPKRFAAFAGCDPIARDGTFNAKGLDEYRYAIGQLGFSGMKLLPPYLFLSPTDPVFYPYYALAAELNTPIIMHQGMTMAKRASIEFARPALLDRVLMDFPTLRISVAHMGEPWEDELLGMMVKHKNLYTDISALCSLGWQRLADDLANARALEVLDRVMFGSDTNCRPTKSYVDWIKVGLNNSLAARGHEPFTEPQIRVLLGEAAQQFLGLEDPDRSESTKSAQPR